MGNMEQNPKSPSFRQLGTLAGFITDFLSTILNFDQVKYWLGQKDELKKKLREVFSIVDEYTSTREEWTEFYKTHFGWTTDFSRVLIPPRPTECFWRLIFITKGITCNKVYEVWTKLFKSWKCTNDLDKDVPINVRISSDDSYAIWVRDRKEPDAEFLGKSTQEVDSEMKRGVTLLERMLLELKYFDETGEHLDVKGITFCSGSRSSAGCVPGVCWDPDDRDVSVVWGDVSGSHSGCGVRQAVSLNS